MSPGTVRVLPVKNAEIVASDARAPSVETRPPSIARPRQLRARLSNVWLPRASWEIARTGRLGLAGLAMIAASAVFFLSTRGRLAEEIAGLRADLAQARAAVRTAAPIGGRDSPRSVRSLPSREDMPQILDALLKQADDAQIAIETAKYEVSTTKAGSIVRYRLSFPIEGPYMNIRRFIDAALTAIPELAIADLSIARKSIADPMVEAQMRVTIFTRNSP